MKLSAQLPLPPTQTPQIYCRLLLLLLLTLFSLHAQSADSSQLTLSTNSTNRFVAVHGRRALVMGYPESGLEVWAYPLQILSGYQIGFRAAGETSETDGRLLLKRVIYQPGSVTRLYIGPNYIVRETLFVPLNQPGAILRYEVQGQVDIAIHFTPVLNLMWPAALGGQQTEWKPDLPGYVISEAAHKLSAIVASREIVTHDDTVNSTVRANGKLSFLIRPHAAKTGPAVATVYIALNPANSQDPASAMSDLSTRQTDEEAQAKTHYADLEDTVLSIQTPDEAVNRALAWSEVALDQAWVCEPELGCGIVAGYGPSRSARRPQYAWFFAGDGLTAVNALVAEGDYSRAREELQFITKYQDPNTGQIWHELSQSAGYIDWSKYPYMFVHVDISFDYLNVVARYVSVSGDTGFALVQWPSIEGAYRYCRSLISATDNLPHIPQNKEGADEQDKLGDDLGLSSSWVGATASFAELASVTGHAGQARDALAANQLARNAIPIHYWDSEHRFWIDGHTAGGAPVLSYRSRPSQAIVQKLFSAQQNETIMDTLASSDFQSDWGTRGVGARSGIFNPRSYSKGSVSALGTAELSATFWLEHRPAVGFALWSAILPWNTLDSLGHLHELLAGDFYHQQVESVPEQTWSSAGLLDGAVRGLLGLEIEGARNRVSFAPHLPPQWGRISVGNVRLPHTVLAFTLKQTLDGADLEIGNQGSTAAVAFQPEIPLGAHLLGAEFQGRTVTVHTSESAADEHAQLEIEAPPGASHCHLRFQGGVSIIPSRDVPHLGDPSTGMKITHVSFGQRVLSVDADVNSSGNAAFRVQTPWKIAGVKGGAVRSLSDALYEITMQRPSMPGNLFGYAHAHVEIAFQ